MNKWQDTVMGILDLKKHYRAVRSGGFTPLHEGLGIDRKGQLLGHMEGCYHVNEIQAEISFKAGMEEVVEFVEENIPKTLSNYVGFWLHWQAQLKEWGINDA